MAKVNGREDALLNAYLNRYQTAQASNVSTGRSTTRKAQQHGSAIMNATDKTLPVLHNSYTETLNNIVQGANLENSLNNDVLNRQMKLAQAKFDAANDLYQQQQKAQQYAAKKAAKKAAKAAKSSGGSSGNGGSTTGTGSDTESAASLDALFGGGVSTSGTTGSTAGSKPKAEDTEKPKTENEKAKEKSAQEKYLEAKKAGARTTAAKSYAERSGTGLVSAAQPAQSRAVTRGGKVIGSSYAAAGSVPSAAETQAAKDKRNDYKSRQEDIAAALKKLQSDADYRAELATPGRKLTSAEVAAVDQYEKSTKNTGFSGLKRVFETAANKENLSQEDYAEKTAAMNAELNQNSALRGKAQMNGAGQTAQAFTAGLYDSVPFLTKSVDKLTGIANATGAELPQLSNAIEGAKSYDPLAAVAGTLVGKGMQYKLFNTAMAGTPLAQAMGKAGNAVVGQAQKIPVLGDALGAGAGDALGRILTDTTADLALDTLPTLADDLSTYSAQQEAIANGQTVDDALTPGKIAGNTAKNIAWNVAMNALPEFGGALFNRLKGTEGDAAQDALKQADDAAQDALKQADNAVQDAQNAAPGTSALPVGTASAVQNVAEAAQNVPIADTTPSMSAAQQAAKSAAAPRSTGTAYMPDNTPVNYRWAAVDANDLVASNDALGSANPAYPREYQNRNRDSAASMQQITRMANDLNPERLTDSANIGDGSPVIRGDNVVLSGNGRTAAIQTAYRDGKADNYRNYVLNHAAEYGIDPSTLPENPVLVRVADDNTDMLKLARGANESTTASFGAAENAVNYGQKVTASSAMSRYNPEKSITDPANNSAVAGLLRDIVPESEYNRMVTKDGKVSLDGYKTAKDAMFSAAYGNSDRLQILAEGGDDSSRNITAAMRDSAANAITLKQMVQRGELPQEFDVANDVSGAADLYAYVKSGNMGKSKTVADYIAGLTHGEDGKFYDGFEEVPYTPMSMYIAEIMEDNRRSEKQTTEFLDNLYASAKEGEGGELTLEGMTDARTRQSIIDDAVRGFYETPERSNNGKTAPNVPFSGEGWANPVGNHPANAAKVAEQVSNTAPSSDAGGAAFLQPTDTASEPVPGMNIVENAQSVAKLNGSESVPANAVGAESTQYNRNEVLNQDYANQRAMGGKIDADEAAAAGIGQQTHTVYSRAEGKDTAKQDFDLLVQQNGDILSAGRTVADELARKSADGNFDASDVYRGYYAADQLQNMMNSYEKGSADAQLVQAQIENLNRAVSAGQSKNAQALSAGRWAQIDEYTPIRKFEQITQRKVNDFAETRDGKQLESLASDVVEMAKSGPQDEEFTAFLKAQGVDVGDNPLNAQMDDLAMRIKRMADTKGIKATDEQAKSAAASILAGGNADDVFNAMARKTLGIENLSQEDYDYVKNAFAEIADMPDSKARYEKELDAYKRLTKYLPAKTFGDKMESIRYLSMLGNTRTHARNVLGNVSMGVVTRAKDNVSGVMQLVLPKDQRTKAVGTTLTADGRKMVDLAKEYGQNKMYSVLYNDGKFNAESGLRAAQDTFTSKPGKVIQKAADINSALLEKEDNIFLTSAFGNAMASQLKARGYDSSVFTATDAKSKQALVDAAATALRDAKEATFHEDNFLSTALKNYQNDIKGHGVGGKILWAVGEGVLPFKKTPLNIAKNAMEYNIVGGTVEAAYRYATGASSADVIDAAAKGLTGTALMGIGGILAYNGLLNGSKSGDDRADAFNEMTGKQEYSINIPGKGTYTIDWASPASVPLLMGAEIANEWQNGGLSVTKFLDAARKIGNPILETTMLQGLNDTLDSVSYADSNDKLATLLGGTLGSYAQQYVPTALGQIARTIDPLRRSTYGGGDSKTERDTNYAIRKAENKIPGLSMNNEPYIDQWGREEANLDGTDDSAGGMFLRGAYNMLSPGYVSAENITPVDEYLQGLYGSTNDSHVYPEKASSKITVDSDDYYMTPEEKTEYAKTSGQTAYDLIDELRQNSMFLQLPEDQQSALVQDAYTVAKTAGGVAAVGDGVSGVNAKEYEAYRDGGAEGFSQYVLMKNATDLVRDEKRETSGNDDATLNTVEKWNTLYSQFGDDAVSNFVNSTDKGSTVRNISDLAGDKAVTAYMQAYSTVANTLDDDQTPDKFAVGYGMQKYGLSGDDFARAYLAAYYKKDKNGKYPEKGGTYADKAGAEIYQSYGADALRDWVNYRATIPDTNGNGKVDKDEAVARLKEMDLTNEMRRAYLAKTNQQWGKKNPF